MKLSAISYTTWFFGAITYTRYSIFCSIPLSSSAVVLRIRRSGPLCVATVAEERVPPEHQADFQQGFPSRKKVSKVCTLRTHSRRLPRLHGGHALHLSVLPTSRTSSSGLPNIVREMRNLRSSRTLPQTPCLVRTDLSSHTFCSLRCWPSYSSLHARNGVTYSSVDRYCCTAFVANDFSF